MEIAERVAWPGGARCQENASGGGLLLTRSVTNEMWDVL